MEHTQTKRRASGPYAKPQRKSKRPKYKMLGIALEKTRRDKVALLRQVLQDKFATRLAQGTKEFSVDSLLHPSDWQREPLAGLFKGNIGKCIAGLVLRQLMDESGVTYRATWYDKPEDPRGHARLYVLEG